MKSQPEIREAYDESLCIYFQPPEPRYRVLSISFELFGQMLFNGLTMGSKEGGRRRAVTFEGLPTDAQIQALRFDNFSRCVQMRIYSSMFSPVAPGAAPPHLELQFFAQPEAGEKEGV